MRATYANYECGRRFPDIDGLVKLAKFYSISLNELVGCNTSSSDNMVVMLRDRQMLETFHQLSDIKQQACLTHIKLDVELELELHDKNEGFC